MTDRFYREPDHKGDALCRFPIEQRYRNLLILLLSLLAEIRPRVRAAGSDIELVKIDQTHKEVSDFLKETM